MEAAKINKRGGRGGGRAGNRGGGRAGNRGSGRAGNRGCGRAENHGRERGRGVARSLDYAMGQPIVEDATDFSSASFAVAGPSQLTKMSMDDVVEVSSAVRPSGPMTSLAGGMRTLAKKTMPRIRVKQWARLPERDRKEVGHFLMPDAPPSKKRRKVSPVRVSCPLMPGTPEVPPPRVPQRWELKKSVLDVNGPSRVVLDEEVTATPPLPNPLLARTLKAQKTDVMGTLRLNRKFVPESLRHKNQANMRPGEVAFSQTRDMTISVWRDTKVVALISTYHKVEVGGKEKYGYYRYKPRVVLDYNQAMGGVDKKDQLLQAFPVERVRNLLWYKKVFRRLLNVSIHNAFVMFPNTGIPKMAQRQFRVRLADEIIQRFRPQKIENPLQIGHFPAKTNIRKSRCKWCAHKKVDTCTVYKCGSCNVNLCIIGCFKDYHISQGLVER